MTLRVLEFDNGYSELSLPHRMTDEHVPVEEYDVTIAVHVLTEGQAKQEISCSSSREAMVQDRY